jgi:hypothetical protein
VQRLSVYDLIRSVLEIKQPNVKWTRAQSLNQLPTKFKFTTHLFPGKGKRDEPVVDGENAVRLLNSLAARATP